ncbi:MAG: 2-hydroxyacyl-CoA dehydratase family protein [Synergistaceae bacterium]|jgi:benzoyl-CoA reductase/2-hydroxyglutaryl-CoA dehydratase subunit BcrC/BadD/HgdB|nr:2-hydroxyacyl-CoA dehydratase family protein [Synergistaceae bacterium]
MKLSDIKDHHDFIEYSKEKHAHSRAMVRFMDYYGSYAHYMEENHVKGNHKAVYSMAYYASSWEGPLIYALGYVPFTYGELGRLSSEATMNLAEDYYQYPSETCSMVKCTVSQWHLRRNDMKNVRRILGSNAICEPYNLAWETARSLGYDIHTVDVLYRARHAGEERVERLVDFAVEELRGVAEWLTGSREIDEAKLTGEIRRRNRIASKVRKILDLRLKHPHYIRSHAAVFMINLGVPSYLGRPQEFEEVLDELTEELENAPVDQKEIDRVVPLIWVGGTGQGLSIYETIDDGGGALLGFRSAPNQLIREDIPPLEALARYACGSQRNNAEVFMRQSVEREVERVKAKGLVLYNYIGCSYASVDREMLAAHFRKQGVPCITLEGMFRIGEPVGQLVTRVNAFIEMLAGRSILRSDGHENECLKSA